MKLRTGVGAAGCVAAAMCMLPASALANTKTVFAGPPPSAQALAAKLLGQKFLKQNNPDVNDFFRHQVTINAGDTVSFVIAGFHTIDLPATGQGDVPLLVPGATVSGVKDAAGKPFWFNGKVPNIGFNPLLVSASGGSTYNGSARVDSGLPLGPPKPFNVTFTKPGTYRYFCDVHYGMVGYVVVKPTGASVPSAKQDAAALTAQVTTDLVAAKKLANTRVPRNQISVGVSGANGVELFNMYPARLRVKRGTTVKFFMSADTREVHTATFGPAKVIKSLQNAFSSSLTFPAQGVYPSDPRQPILLSPKSHGDGFGNVGVMDRDSGTPQVPASGRIKFTKPGVYRFACLIHPQMHGTIIVTK